MRTDRGPSRPFYVGYLSLPRAHRAFLSVAIPLAVAGMLAGALGLARTQGPWGDGVWQTGDASFWRGTLTLEPYPMLHVQESKGRIETYLLVEMGKFGTLDRFGGEHHEEGWPGAVREQEGVDGAAIEVRGRELRRDGRHMIEVDPDSEVMGPSWRVVEDPAVRAPVVYEPGRVEIEGEIVDSKCYLGAMKPGAGRGHKACATLCIDGGIPPVLVERTEFGGSRYWLLADSMGGPLDGSDLEGWRQRIGERVVLSGRAGRIGTWRVLSVVGLSE